ncbi:plasmid mobilization protein [Puia dinghuensis]|uniref:Plasmid mobilization relaxosome protein MobC n=1 Tax=Puia dinghuensis TaxID=1792502 RepID=A0A8J2XPV5_9BACT|nr:plasmid mobilization relaxosome protein MobC [Puia dinghuensis]GGA82153.1 hypothetical protein GCM10011511_01400 [Puia dinghuensis]
MDKTNTKRTKWLKIRMTEEEHQAVEALQRKSASKNPSEYARKALLSEPKVLHYHNQSLDDFEKGMLQLKAELKAISGNFDQVVRHLRTLRHLPDLQQWILVNEKDKTRLNKQIDTISTTIEKAYELWSRESIPLEASPNPLPTTKKK